jgi:hypothetical protein
MRRSSYLEEHVELLPEMKVWHYPVILSEVVEIARNKKAAAPQEQAELEQDYKDLKPHHTA